MFTHGDADVNGIQLHYVTAGEGKPIVFLHGAPEFWYEWKNQLAEFSRDHRTVAPDLRGFNLSSKPPEVEQYRKEHLVEDVRVLADHLGLRPFTLVGHDWGGGVAYAFALTYPDYLERLVIVNMAHPAIFDRELRENPAHQQACQYMLEFRAPGSEEVFSADNFAGETAMFRKAGLSEDDLRLYQEAWSQPGWLRGCFNYYRAEEVGPPGPDGSPANGNYVPYLSDLTVRVPTLVIWGEKDPMLLTSNLDGLESYVPDLTVRRIPEGSHWVIHEQPDLVNGYIRTFLGEG
jgi:pimeloyl-ACP methyl ester carboxylesterase